MEGLKKEILSSACPAFLEMKKILKNTTLTACALIFALLLVEVFLRFTMPIEIHAITSECYIPSLNPKIAYELKPLAFDFNRDGLRDRDYPPEKAEGCYRILIAGDSLAYGYGLQMSETYAKRLEWKLNLMSKKKYEVINLGVPGYRMTQIVERIKEKGLKYNPDMIIYGYWLDDISMSSNTEEADLTRKAADQINSNRIVMTENPLERNMKSLLFNFQIIRRIVATKRDIMFRKQKNNASHPEDEIRKNLGEKIYPLYMDYCRRVDNGELKDIRGHDPYYAFYRDADRFMEWNDAFEELSGLCREKDLECLLLMTPELYDHDNGNYNWKDLHHFIHEIAGIYQIPTLDLSHQMKMYAASRVARPDDMEHPNAFGAEIIADNLLHYFRINSLLVEDSTLP